MLAHDLLVEHTIDSNCEWLCQNSHNDDGLINSNVQQSSQKICSLQLNNYQSAQIAYNAFRQPYLRGPPN